MKTLENVEHFLHEVFGETPFEFLLDFAEILDDGYRKLFWDLCRILESFIPDFLLYP